MSIFGKLFGNKTQSLVQQQLPETEAALLERIADFQDATRLQSVLIFPVLHKLAAQLYVEDFGVDGALKTYERLFAVFTSDGTIREDQFRSFGWPDISPQEAPHTAALNTMLWKLARGLIERGTQKEAIAQALLHIAMRGASRLDATLIAPGFLLTILKELRAGAYTPAPEVRPEATEGADEVTTAIFNRMRDMAYTAREHMGLDWQHLLPGIQRVCVIYVMRYRNKEHTLETFRDQVRKIEKLEGPRNPPQQYTITPLHVTNMATFNSAFQELADHFGSIRDVHPSMIAEALGMLVIKVASAHYDLVYLMAILTASCNEIEEGKFDFVRQTH